MASYKDHFSATAAAYASRRPSYPLALVRWLATQCPEHHCAWDAGCGSGQLSVLLADVFDRVIATDASRDQIAQAAPHPRVVYRVANAESDPARAGLPDFTVDLCVAAQAAHWFDMDGYVRQVRRVSKPGGVAALVSYGVMEIDWPDLHTVIGDFYHGELASYWPAERRHVENGYRELSWPFAPIKPPTLQIELCWPLDALLGYLDTWSAISAMKKAGQQARVEQFQSDVRAIWPRADAAATVRFPLTVRAGRVI